MVRQIAEQHPLLFPGVQLRAARFGGGGDASSESKKQARAERFGLATNPSSSKIGAAPSADLETLRKRAERFGQSSSNVMKKAELDEKLKKRQERFGEVQPAKKMKKIDILDKVEINKTLKSPEKAAADEMKQKRAERFGTAAAATIKA